MQELEKDLNKIKLKFPKENIIDVWLEKYSDPECEKEVKAAFKKMEDEENKKKNKKE